jgi:hypothetical protein
MSLLTELKLPGFQSLSQSSQSQERQNQGLSHHIKVNKGEK